MTNLYSRFDAVVFQALSLAAFAGSTASWNLGLSAGLTWGLFALGITASLLALVMSHNLTSSVDLAVSVMSNPSTGDLDQLNVSPGYSSLAQRLTGAARALSARTKKDDLWLSKGAETCDAIMCGDFEARLISIDASPPVTKLLLAVNRMIDVTDAFVRESGAAMDYVSRGKFFRRVLPNGLLGQFRRQSTIINAATTAMQDKTFAFSKMTNEFEQSLLASISIVSSAATELQATSESLIAVSDSTLEKTTAVAAATEEASVSVQTVAAASEELSASIGDIEHRVTQASDMTSAAAKEAVKATEQISRLDAAAREIGVVLKLIADIAAKTNLLALNATIEAARAGEAGRGFAVVAMEVKSLASQTASATDEIRERIESIQAETHSAVQGVEGISKTMNQVSAVSAEISNAMDQQTAATKEIASSVSQASQGTAEVAHNTTKVSQSAQETDRSARDVLAAANELSVQAVQLKTRADDFLRAARAV
jgi:methyl-accepting chemotaxis protein